MNGQRSLHPESTRKPIPGTGASRGVNTLPGVRCEKAQELVLHERQIQRTSLDRGLVGLQVQRQRPVNDQVLFLPAPGPPEQVVTEPHPPRRSRSRARSRGTGPQRSSSSRTSLRTNTDSTGRMGAVALAGGKRHAAKAADRVLQRRDHRAGEPSSGLVCVRAKPDPATPRRGSPARSSTPDSHSEGASG